MLDSILDIRILSRVKDKYYTIVKLNIGGVIFTVGWYHEHDEKESTLSNEHWEIKMFDVWRGFGDDEVFMSPCGAAFTGRALKVAAGTKVLAMEKANPRK